MGAFLAELHNFNTRYRPSGAQKKSSTKSQKKLDPPIARAVQGGFGDRIRGLWTESKANPGGIRGESLVILRIVARHETIHRAA